MYRTVADGVKRFLTPFNLKICLVLVLLALVARPFGMDTVVGFELHVIFWVLVVGSSSLMGHISNGLGDWICGEAAPWAAT